MEMELPIGDRIKITAELKKNGGNGKCIIYAAIAFIVRAEKVEGLKFRL